MKTNLAQYFFTKAKQHPHKTALLFPENEKISSQWSFADLALNAEMFTAGLRSSGFQKGDRIIWLAPLTPATYYFTISCLMVGAVPVFIEAGLPMKLLKKCISQAQAKAIVSSQALYRYLYLFPEIWSLKKYSVDPRPIPLQPFVHDFRSLEAAPPARTEFAELKPDDLCLLTFTTGSTGIPKAAERTFKCLLAQHQLSQKYWPEHENEVDMPVFPNVVFQNLLCGVTTVLPHVNFHELRNIRADRVVEQICLDQVSRLSGSPRFLEQLCDYILAHKIATPVRNLIVGGAPVRRQLAEKIERAFPQSKNYVVYGSTEVEPIAYGLLSEMIRKHEVGYFVGQALAEIDVKICHPETMQEAPEGEIWLSGPHVVERYFRNEAATRATKPRDQNGKVWHRTGDWGRQTKDGLILMGRVPDLLHQKGHCIANYLVESELEELDFIERASVLEIHDQVQICLQKSKSSAIDPAALENILKKYELSKTRIRLFDELPVDPRHNSKIDRETLRARID